MNTDTLVSHFQKHFTHAPECIVRAPGRINLIGEHTDYNGGYVLPAAIDKAVWLAAGRRDDGRFAFYAADLDDFYLSDGPETAFQTRHTWANYLLGVISEAQKEGHEIGGLNIAFSGDVPLGAGLSSSAALESGALAAVNRLYRLGLEKMDIVRLAQRGENHFVGMKCGIMDMFASVMGRAESVVRLDCRSLEYAYFPFETNEYALLLLDSAVKHQLVDSEYNTRREECETGVAVLQRHDPAVASLRDVSPALLNRQADEMPPLVYRRCRYVVEEIARVEAACEALLRGDWPRVGALMYATHDGLNKDYAVCVPETNFLVELARAHPSVVGARQMGGGFGGCTINLVKIGDVDQIIEAFSAAYDRVFGKTLKAYPVRLCDGVGVE